MTWFNECDEVSLVNYLFMITPREKIVTIIQFLFFFFPIADASVQGFCREVALYQLITGQKSLRHSSLAPDKQELINYFIKIMLICHPPPIHHHFPCTDVTGCWRIKQCQFILNLKKTSLKLKCSAVSIVLMFYKFLFQRYSKNTHFLYVLCWYCNVKKVVKTL